MKIRKSDKYKNYGPIPQNEYSAANSGKSTDASDVLGVDPQTGGQRLIKRQTQQPSGRRRACGWSRTWKANGWRAESASRDDEFMDMGRYSGYVWKSSRPLRPQETDKLRVVFRMHGTRYSGYYRHGIGILWDETGNTKLPHI